MRFRHTIVRLMSLCHGSALEEIGGEESDFCETIDVEGLSDETQKHLKECAEVPGTSHEIQGISMEINEIQ